MFRFASRYIIRISFLIVRATSNRLVLDEKKHLNYSIVIRRFLSDSIIVRSKRGICSFKKETSSCIIIFKNRSRFVTIMDVWVIIPWRHSFRHEYLIISKERISQLLFRVDRTIVRIPLRTAMATNYDTKWRAFVSMGFFRVRKEEGSGAQWKTPRAALISRRVVWSRRAVVIYTCNVRRRNGGKFFLKNPLRAISN